MRPVGELGAITAPAALTSRGSHRRVVGDPGGSRSRVVRLYADAGRDPSDARCPAAAGLVNCPDEVVRSFNDGRFEQGAHVPIPPFVTALVAEN